MGKLEPPFKSIVEFTLSVTAIDGETTETVWREELDPSEVSEIFGTGHAEEAVDLLAEGE